MCDEVDGLSVFHQGQILSEGLMYVREDICDWFTILFNETVITGDTFLPSLQTGVLLCDLLHKIYQHASPDKLPSSWPKSPPIADRKASPATFKANDNVSLFLNWCRAAGFRNTILFETIGLMNNNEEKNVVLTLLYLGEVCVDLGIPVPQFARFKREMEQNQLTEGSSELTSTIDESNTLENVENALSSVALSSLTEIDSGNTNITPSVSLPSSKKASTDKTYRMLLSEVGKRCCCETKFRIEYSTLHEGMYQIGAKIIFVRMFKDHIMLRIGGGWETLDEYLKKVDPCRKDHLRQKTLPNVIKRSVAQEKRSPIQVRKFSDSTLTKVTKVHVNRSSLS